MSQFYPGPFTGPFGPCSRVSPAADRRDHRRGDRRRNAFRKMLGHCVCVNLVGDDKVEGRLLYICGDLLVLDTHDGIVYVNLDQVESVSESGGAKSDGRRPRFIRAANFRDLVRDLEGEFVKISWGRRDKVKGFISDVGRNTVTVIDGDRRVEVFIDRIKTIQPLDARDRLGHCSRGHRSGDSRSDGSRTGAIGRPGINPGVPDRIAGERSEGGRAGSGSSGRSGGRSGGDRSAGSDFDWTLGADLLPEPPYQPNRYGVPESFLMNTANRKRKPSASKARKKR